jgi:hypothetical protein
MPSAAMISSRYRTSVVAIIAAEDASIPVK